MLAHGRQAPDAVHPTATPSVAERWRRGALEPPSRHGRTATRRRGDVRLAGCLPAGAEKPHARPWVVPSRPGRGDGVARRGLTARGRESPVAVVASRRRLGSREYGKMQERRRYSVSGGSQEGEHVGFVFISWAFGFRIEIVGPVRNKYFFIC